MTRVARMSEISLGLRALGLSTVDAFEAAAHLENAENAERVLEPDRHQWAMSGFVWPPVAT